MIEKIKSHTLGDKEEAFALYFSFCDALKEKYGPVDRDYDENPTKRGKEWLDIHHIKEYELDDIACRTQAVRDIEKLMRDKKDDEVVIVAKTGEIWSNRDQLIEKARQDNPQASHIHIILFRLDCTLEELKPYNVKEQLVYANKIEHFLLHYLIDSIRGQEVFSGGPNFLWDCAIALDVYGFDREYLNKLQSEKEKFYSIMSSEEITRLYKKLIDWKKWNIEKCSRFWHTYKGMLRHLRQEKVSYVLDKTKFFKFIAILRLGFYEKDEVAIQNLPYKVKPVMSRSFVDTTEIEERPPIPETKQITLTPEQNEKAVRCLNRLRKKKIYYPIIRNYIFINKKSEFRNAKANPLCNYILFEQDNKIYVWHRVHGKWDLEQYSDIDE